MIKKKVKKMLFILVCLGLSVAAHATVKTYPQLWDIQNCQFSYTLKAKDHGTSTWDTVALYNAMVTNSSGHQVNTTVGNFDCDGPTDIQIIFSSTVTSAEVYPSSLNITPAINGDTITFTISGPEKFYVDINDDHYNNCMHIIAQPIEENPPQEGDPNVIFIPTGIFADSTISLQSGQTLYIQGGAAVRSIYAGYDADRLVKNVFFKDLNINGSYITSAAAGNFSIGSYTDNIVFTTVYPSITSSLMVGGNVDKLFRYQITAINSPISYDATGLPEGLRVNKRTGLIFGMPREAGTFPVTISATNTYGTVNSTLYLGISSVFLPWSTSDIGSVGMIGNASDSLGTFTLEGSGADIWGTSDEFRYVYRSLSGDGEIIARVESVENTDGWAKAGVMIRDSLDAGSKYGMVAISPENGATFQYRTSTDGSSGHIGVSVISAPYWVRLVRSGDTITGYHSSDGFNWAKIGSDIVSMSTDVYAGLAVTSHSDGTLCTSTIDNVSITGGDCKPITLIPYYQIDHNRWQQGTDITTDAGSTITLSPWLSYTGFRLWDTEVFHDDKCEPNPIRPWPRISSWVWNTGETTRNITITDIQKSSVYAVRYTDKCESLSTQLFKIAVNGHCEPDSITPWMNIDGDDWQKTDSISVLPGSTLILGPVAGIGSSFSWSTGDSTQYITLSNITSDTIVTCYVVNHCGSISSRDFKIKIKEIFPGQTYVITAKHSGQSIDVSGGSTTAGANILQWPYSGATNQQWVVEDAGNDYYKLKCVKSGMYMDIDGGSTADGANVLQWTATTGLNQQYEITSVGGGYFTIKPRHSGKCIEVVNSSTDNGANVQQMTCNGGSNQIWSFELASETGPAPGITSSTTASGVVGESYSYTIKASNSPISYDATNLPSGLSVNTSTGVISGTPSSEGTWPVTISATNIYRTCYATLTITIVACAPTPITPYYQIDGGTWQQGTVITINEGSSIQFGPQPSEDNYTWSGCGLDNASSSDNQTISPAYTCYATATYTNSCGLESSVTFDVIVNRPNELTAGETYVITAEHSDQSIDVNAASTTPGANILQWPYGGATNQQWILEDAGSGYFKIKCSKSGLYMDIDAASTADGANVLQWTATTGYNQHYLITPVSSGYYNIKPRHSGKCIEVENSSTDNGANVQQMTCNGGTNQNWSFKLVSLKSARSIENIAEEASPDVSVYPNPVGDVLYIKNITVGDVIYLYKSTGELILKATVDNNNWEVNMGALDPGIYILGIVGSEKADIQKIIKN